MEDPNYSRNHNNYGRGGYKKKRGDYRQRGTNRSQDYRHSYHFDSRNHGQQRESDGYSQSKDETSQNSAKSSEVQKTQLTVANSNLNEIKTSDEPPASIDCVICTDPIKYFVIGRCNHKQVCLICSLRRRKLYQEFDCAVCRKILDCVIVTSDPSSLFETFNVKEMSSHYDGKFYHLEPHFLEVSKMWDLTCQICSKRNFTNITELEKHVEAEHSLQYCKLCLEYRKVFLSEQKLYSQNTLLLHLTEVDPETRVKHEVCEICMQPFYDTDTFYHHIQTNCRGGGPNTYAPNNPRSASIQEQFSQIATQNRNILPTSSTWGRNRTMDINENNFPALGNSPSRTQSTAPSPSGSWGERKNTEQANSSTGNSNTNANSTNLNANSNSTAAPPRTVQNITNNNRQRQHEPVVLHFGGLPNARRKK